MRLLCNIDWLEVYCKRSTLDPPQNTAHLLCHKEPYTTRVYRDVYRVVTDYGVPVATATCTPLSSKSQGGILLDSIMHIKVANFWLYTDKWRNMLDAVLQMFNATVVNISRLDVCGDWQYAANGCPADKMLQNIAVGKYRKVYQPNWHLHARSEDTLRYNSIGFGSKSSPVFTRFYNKSLELKQAKDKPYIRELWDAFGFSKGKDVYRVEFSLSGVGKMCVDDETGEIITYNIDDICTNRQVCNIFVHLAQRYFDIRVYDNARSSRCTPIQVFPRAPKPYIPVHNITYEESTRTDKTIINRLRRYLLSPKYDDGDALAMLYLIKDIADAKRLWDWLGCSYDDLCAEYIRTHITCETSKDIERQQKMLFDLPV